MNNNIYKLARVMAEFEGWKADDMAGANAGRPSASYRNHNPGNLRFSPFQLGTRDGFAYFLNDDIGFFAMMWDLWKKCKGETQTGLNGESTIADLIRVWAPPKENAPENYINYVTQFTGFNRDKKLKELL